MSAPIKDTTSVTISRQINATPEQIYPAFTASDAINRWFCDRSYIQAEENGNYLFIWNLEEYSATGQFKEIIENEKLVLSWRSTYQGQESEYAETLTITFDSNEQGTSVTFFHDGMPQDSVDDYSWQWNKRLDDLKLYIETGALPNIVNRVIIGIYPGAVSDDMAEKLDMESGVYSKVTALVPDYSAEKAGIQVGDFITHINGQKISPDHNMNHAVRGKKGGDEVEVSLYRDGETLTLTMELSPYPIPEVPNNLSALADNVTPQYDTLITDLTALFDGVSEDDASTIPAEGEWSAKMVLAHLIYTEKHMHEGIGARITGRQPTHWSGNDETRLNAMITVNPSVSDLLAELRKAYNETLAIWRMFPEDVAQTNKNHLWSQAFNISGMIQHTRNHMEQIQQAIASA